METMYIWLGIFIIGLALFFLAIFRKQSAIKIPQAPGAFIGAIMMIVGYMWGVAPLYSESAPFEAGEIVVTTGDEIAAPTFSIDANAVITNIWDSAVGDCITTATFDASETTYTIPVSVNTGGTHDAIAVNYSAINFTATPIPPTGANADDLATIYFESDYNIKHESEYVFKTNGAETIFFANWTRVGTVGDAPSWDHSGQDTMLLTEDETYQIAYGFNGGENALGNVFKTVGETITWHITFHNADWSWSKVYTVNAIVIASA